MILLGERVDTADLLSVVESCIDELRHSQRDINLRKVTEIFRLFFSFVDASSTVQFFQFKSKKTN